MSKDCNIDVISSSGARYGFIIGGVCAGLFLGFGSGYRVGADRIRGQAESALSELSMDLEKRKDEINAKNSELAESQSARTGMQADLRQTKETLAKAQEDQSRTQSELNQRRGELERAAEKLKQASERVSDLEKFVNAFNERFVTKTVTNTFTQQLKEFQASGIGRLDVGTLDSVVTVKRSEKKSTAYDWIYLGTTVAEIEAPVTYRYHLDLGAPWEIKVVDHHCIVKAPKITPSLPTAIHSDKMKKYSENAWSSFDKSDVADIALRSLTPKANEEAGKDSNLKIVYEPAREVVTRFIKTWLTGAGGWSEEKVNSISVTFADEPASDITAPPFKLSIKSAPVELRLNDQENKIILPTKNSGLR